MAKEEQFRVLREEDAVSNWRRYLELQVKLFAKTEFELFRQYGLNAQNSPILDLGCGPGLYSRALRAWDSSISVLAADTNEALLKELRDELKRLPDPGLSVIHWTAGASAPPTEIRSCKVAILRYVLQHNHKPVEILRALTQSLSKGTLVFLIEEDDGLYQFEPPFPAFEKLIGVWSKWAKAFKADRLIGRKLPKFAAKAGLEVVDLRVINHSPYLHGIESFLEYFKLSFDVVASTTPKVLNPTAARKMASDFDRYAAKNGPHCFIYYPQVVTVARVL